MAKRACVGLLASASIVGLGLLAPGAASAQAPPPAQPATKAQLADLVRLEKQAQHCGLTRENREFDTFFKNTTTLSIVEGSGTANFLELLCLRLGCAEDGGKTRPALAVARPADCGAFLQRFRAMRMTRTDWKPAEGVR